MTIATKADFLGMWRIDRRIDDARGPDAHFVGSLLIKETGDERGMLIVTEDGYLKIGDQTPVSANRSYRWVFRTATVVEVLFEDGRPFHTFDLSSPTPKAHHDCPPDQYDVAYDFQTPNEWRATWTVRGPRKDYVMSSAMTREPKRVDPRPNTSERMALRNSKSASS